MSFKSGVKCRGSDRRWEQRWWLWLMRWYAQDEVNQEDSEQNEVDGMKKGADFTGKVMHMWESGWWSVCRHFTTLSITLDIREREREKYCPIMNYCVLARMSTNFLSVDACVVSLYCRELHCEWSGMWDDMEHQRTTSVPRLDCWNTEQRSAADHVQVLYYSLIDMVVNVHNDRKWTAIKHANN